MLWFAYDGSVNGDWVARYAIRLASHAPGRTVRLLHVHRGDAPHEWLGTKLDRIEHECGEADVRLEPMVRPARGGVLHTILEEIPEGPDSLVVCGTRVRATGRGYLAGTLSEELLRLGRWNVLALRVLQPGLLGVPRRFLVPVAGHPRGLAQAWPFLELFAPDMRELHVLHVVARGTGLAPLGRRRLAERRTRGREYVDAIERELRARLTLSDGILDSIVRVADDWVGQLIIHASQHRSQLICVGASERGLPHRLLAGNPLERLLRTSPCDVGVYRGPS